MENVTSSEAKGRDVAVPALCIGCIRRFYKKISPGLDIDSGSLFHKPTAGNHLTKEKEEMIKKIVAALVMAAFLCPPALCFADITRMGEISCAQFRRTNPNFRGEMIAWLYGYWSHENGSDIMGDGLRDRFGNNLLEFCDKNPEKNILEALKNIPKK